MLILTSTETITSQKTIITEIRQPNIKSREVSRVADSNGSTTRKTEKELHIGTMPQPRNSTEALHQMLPDQGKTFVGALTQAGRISPEGLLIVAVGHSVAWTAAAAQKTSAAVDNRAVKACPVAAEDSVAAVAAAVEDSAVVPVAAVAGSAVVPVAAVAADAAAVEEEGGRYVKISFKRNTSGKGG
jgi:hypothetical protein